MSFMLFSVFPAVQSPPAFTYIPLQKVVQMWWQEAVQQRRQHVYTVLEWERHTRFQHCKKWMSAWSLRPLLWQVWGLYQDMNLVNTLAKARGALMERFFFSFPVSNKHGWTGCWKDQWTKLKYNTLIAHVRKREKSLSSLFSSTQNCTPMLTF